MSPSRDDLTATHEEEDEARDDALQGAPGKLQLVEERRPEPRGVELGILEGVPVVDVLVKHADREDGERRVKHVVEGNEKGLVQGLKKRQVRLERMAPFLE